MIAAVASEHAGRQVRVEVEVAADAEPLGELPEVLAENGDTAPQPAVEAPMRAAAGPAGGAGGGTPARCRPPCASGRA